jgi:hypothetical protein
MSFFNWLANGLGTLFGVVTEVVSAVVDTVRSVYDAFVESGRPVKEAAAEESRRTQEHLREVNDEIMHLRNRGMSGSGLSEQDRRRWQELREERDELRGALLQAKEVKAAEKILDSESVLQKVEVDLETMHVLQYNAFADTLGKKCTCGRQMKLQWQRDLSVAGPKDFFWGCTGWYVPMGQGRACNRREPLQRADYALITDTSAPEFSVTAEEFGVILEDPGTSQIVISRVNDLRSDLATRKRGVELATCPLHGENMVLRRKSNPSGLLDAYFLACPHWQPNGQGCSFIEKLKSGSQLAALLKAETGRGIL